MALNIPNLAPNAAPQTYNELSKEALANQNMAIQNQYLPQKLALANQLAQQQNKYYGPNIESEIGLRGAQSNLMGTEAARNQFLTRNPAYLNPDAFMIMQSLRQGSVPSNQAMPSNAMNQQDIPGFNRPVTGTPEQANAIANMQPGEAIQIGAPTNALANNPMPGVNKNPFGIQPPGTPMQTGNPQLDAMMAKRFGIGPQSQAQMDAYKDQLNQQVKGYGDAQDAAHISSAAANDSNQNLQTLLDTSKKMGFLESGSIGGYNRAWTDAAQQFDQAAANLVKTTAREWQSAHITDRDVKLIQSGKINRTMNPEVRDNIASMILANNSRVQERENFLNAALHNTDAPMTIQTANQLWDMYQQQRPAYNSKDFIANNSYKNSWQDYLSPEAVVAAQNKQPFIPGNQSELSSKIITNKDIEDTAKKHGQTVSQVRRNLQQSGVI